MAPHASQSLIECSFRADSNPDRGLIRGGVEFTICNPSTGREKQSLSIVPDEGVRQGVTMLQMSAMLPAIVFEQVAPDRLRTGSSVCPHTGRTVQGSSHGETFTTHHSLRFSVGAEAVLDGRGAADWIAESSG